MLYVYLSYLYVDIHIEITYMLGIYFWLIYQ